MIGDQNSVKSGEGSKKAPVVPPLVKFYRAFKLAEQWVSKMSYLDEDDKSSKSKLESRPPRLGVGATIARQPQVIHSNDPVERKISTILETQKRRGLKNAEELADSAKTSNPRQRVGVSVMTKNWRAKPKHSRKKDLYLGPQTYKQRRNNDSLENPSILRVLELISSYSYSICR